MLHNTCKKRFLSGIFVVVLMLNLVFPVYAAEEQLPELTLEDFAAMTFNQRRTVIDMYKNEILNIEDDTPSISPAYKSGENDPCHQLITSTAIVELMNDYGFWESGSEGLVSALTISLASALPDMEGDESYEYGNCDHFYCVPFGTGMNVTKNSAEDSFIEYYNKAVAAMKQNNKTTAYQHLGRALHYSQDVTVPHHTAGALTIAHYNYEAFCYNNAEAILANIPSMTASDYQYLRTSTLGNIVVTAANYAHQYYFSVDNSLSTGSWYNVANILMPYSARRTAGILYRFAYDCGLTLYY